jgi:phosphate-selective porin OprO/OprP
MEKSKLIYTILFFFSLSLLYTIQAQEKKFQKTVKVNGRIQYDYEFLKRDKLSDWFNGNEFRRVHLSASGLVAPKIKYKVEASFAHATIGFRDVYIKYLGGKYGNFAIGSMAEPTGLDMATSSKYIPFFERAMLTSMQNFRWGSGIHYENYHLFEGKAGVQVALTNNGSNSEGFKDPELEKGQNFVARFFGAPLYNKENNSLLHLGFNYAHRPYKKLSFRPENHMGDKYTYNMPGGDNRVIVGGEIAANYQSFSLQAEYKSEKVDNDLNLDYKINGYYLMGSYFITGEHRPYKKGAFGRVKPIKDISNGGYGALEVLVRYSSINPSQDVVDVNPTQPDQINNITFGLNWYLTSHARIMYNYVLTDDQDDVLGNLKGHLIRFQIDF